jgi:hypothetical protein
VVEQEEAGEAELLDERELALEARTRCLRLSAGIALDERCLADGSELVDGRIGFVREVRVAVAELLGEIELEPFRERHASLGGGAIELEALEHFLWRAQVALTIAAALRLAPLERRPAADGDEDVLEQRPPRVVRVHVPGRHGLDPEMLGEIAQEGEPARVSPFVRPLQLDVEALATEDVREASRRVRVE